MELGKRRLINRSDGWDRSSDFTPSKTRRKLRTNSSASEIPRYVDSDSQDVVEKTL
jgi:hypothetical protein